MGTNMTSTSLDDISTSLDAHVITTTFLLHDEGDIDKLEYGMGLIRGGISAYDQNPALVVGMYEDMRLLMRSYRWALLPTLEVLQSIVDLFLFNFNQLPNARRHFIQDLPDQVYDYQLLPPLDLESGAFLPFYVNGVRVKNPRRPLHIKSRVHPCFVLPSLVHYELFPREEKFSPNPITRAVEDLLTAYCCITHQPVYLSWLGPRDTWSKFRRNFLLALEDPPPGSAPRYVRPTSNKKGKGATGRKPSSQRSHSAAKKSAHLTNTRRTKGKRTTSFTVEAGTPPTATGMTTRRTVRSR